MRIPTLCVIIMLLQACAAGNELRTESVDRAGIAGTYTLYLYGCHNPTQLNNVAILVNEQSAYPLDIFDLDTSYTVKKGVEAHQALLDADSFLRCTPHRIMNMLVKRIPDSSGGTYGYEMRPEYQAFDFEAADALETHYWLENGRVRVVIKKRHDPEEWGGGDRRERRGFEMK